jgi:hypothetical protein
MTARASILVVALLAACGGGGGGSSSANTLVVCDLRTRPLHVCEEIRAPADEVAAAGAQAECTTAGGTWGFDPCPATSLIGSCTYTWGPADCERHFYPPGPGYDPVFWCTMSSWDGAHGVWHPAP